MLQSLCITLYFCIFPQGRTSHGGGGGGDEDNNAEEGKEPSKDEKSDKDESKSSGENQWHFDQQQILRDQVKGSGLSVREFKTAEDGCALIKAVKFEQEACYLHL